MLDDVVLNKAAIIERCLLRIETEYPGHEQTLDSDFIRQDSIILNLQRTCEAAIDLAMHTVRVRGLGLPQESRDAFRLLQEKGLISGDLSHRLQAMVGFRNIAVHVYQDLDIAIVRVIVDERLGDFRAFVKIMLQQGAKSE